MLNVAVKQKRLADNPCRGRRVSRIGSKIHSQTSLHDSYRTDQDRVRSTQLPAERRCHPVGNRASVQEGTPFR